MINFVIDTSDVEMRLNENKFLFDNYNFITNKNLSESVILSEGAKLDMQLKNFLKEGEDYKGLKGLVKEAITYHNLDDKDLMTGRNGFVHFCKRFIQKFLDISDYVLNTVGLAVGGVASIHLAATPLAGSITMCVTIIAIIITHCINRILRYAADSAEYAAIRKDTKEIIKQLEVAKEKTKNKKDKDKIQNSINRINKELSKNSDYKKESTSILDLF